MFQKIILFFTGMCIVQGLRQLWSWMDDVDDELNHVGKYAPKRAQYVTREELDTTFGTPGNMAEDRRMVEDGCDMPMSFRALLNQGDPCRLCNKMPIRCEFPCYQKKDYQRIEKQAVHILRENWALKELLRKNGVGYNG